MGIQESNWRKNMFLKKQKDSVLIHAVFISSMITMILSNLTAFAGSIIDGVFISKCLGTSAMAAFQLYVPLNMAMVLINKIFSVGIQSVCSFINA